MSCRRAIEIDLAGFLAEPRAPGYADFRDHYPRCAECAAELRVWTELQLELEADRAHPEPEQLVAYTRDEASLAPDARRMLEAHVARCASCRDELVSLGRFDPAKLATSPSRESAPGVAERRPLLGRMRGWLWHPALAYGVASVLLVSLVWSVSRPQPEPAAGPVVASLPRRDAGSPAETAERMPARSIAPGAPRAAAKAADRVASVADAPAATAPQAALQTPPRAADPPPAPAAEADEAVAAPTPTGAREGRVRALEDRASEQPREERSTFAGTGLAQQAAREAEPVAPLRLTLRGGRVLRVSARATEQPLRLAVPVPIDARAPGEAELRLREPSGQRELRERRSWQTAPAFVELTVPGGWLRPGAYRVDFVPLEGAPSEFVVEVLAR